MLFWGQPRGRAWWKAISDWSALRLEWLPRNPVLRPWRWDYPTMPQERESMELKSEAVRRNSPCCDSAYIRNLHLATSPTAANLITYVSHSPLNNIEKEIGRDRRVHVSLFSSFPFTNLLGCGLCGVCVCVCVCVIYNITIQQ